MSVIDSGEASSGDDSGMGLSRKESKRTIQFLDRLGHGLVTSGQQEVILGKPGRIDPRNEVRTLSADFRDQSAPTAAEADLASLGHIRSLIATNKPVGCGDGRGETKLALSSPGLSAAHVPAIGREVLAAFRDMRNLLEQNAGWDSLDNEEVALECLKVLKEVISWLGRIHGETQSKNSIHLARREQAPLQGPGHHLHITRGCIASIVPSVIDCCSMARLRDPAEDVLAECAGRQENLPDMACILVEQLVRHGMEHEDNAVRFWSTVAPLRLMARGLCLDDRQYSLLLEGLVGRIRDVDDAVVVSAVDALREMYDTSPDRFQRSEGCLGTCYRKLLRDYRARISSQGEAPRALGREGSGRNEETPPLHVDQGTITGIKACSRHSPPEMVSGSSCSYPQEKNRTSDSNSEQDGEGNCGDVAREIHRHPLMSPDDASMTTRKGERGVEWGKTAKKTCGDPQTSADTASGEKDKRASADILPAGRPPRPVLSGLTSTKVTAVLGDGRGMDSFDCALSSSPGYTRPMRDARPRFGGDGGRNCGCINNDGGGASAPPGFSRTSSLSTESVELSPKLQEVEIAASPPREVGAAVARPRNASIKRDSMLSPSTSPEELLQALVGIESARVGVDDNNGPGATVSVGFNGFTRFPDGGQGTARGRRDERIQAMETAKRMVLDLDVDAPFLFESRREEMLVLLLRLADDPDFKIALLALQILHVLVVCLGKRIQPHTALLLRHLIAKLGDYRVAARHHATVVLSSIVLAGGLSLAVPSLTEQGLRSTAWRVREGSLKLVIAGLRSPPPVCPSPAMGDREARGGVDSPGEIECVSGTRLGVDKPFGPYEGSILDKTRLVRNVGLLLTDERSEVRFAAMETLAVAASAWRPNKEVDLISILEEADLLRSGEIRRRLVARIQDPDSSLPRLGPGEVVDLGGGLARWCSLESTATGETVEATVGGGNVTVPPRRIRDAGNANNAHANTPPSLFDGEGSGGDGDRSIGDGEAFRERFSSAGGEKGGSARLLRCWRSNQFGELREVCPWERRTLGSARGTADNLVSSNADENAGVGGDVSTLAVGDSTGRVRTETGSLARRRTEVAHNGLIKSPGNSGSRDPSRRASLPQWRSEGVCGGHGYVPSWGERSKHRGTLVDQQVRGQRASGGDNSEGGITQQTLLEGDSRGQHRRRPRNEPTDPMPLPQSFPGSSIRREASTREEEEKPEALWGGPYGANTGASGENEGDRGGNREASAALDPTLLSTLKRGVSRNARVNRRSVSAAAGGDVVASMSPGEATRTGSDPTPPVFGGGQSSRPRGAAPAEPTTPVPVGRYDSMGRRRHMETTAQQPLPLVARPGAGGRGGPRRVSWGACDERLVPTANGSDSGESLHGGRRGKRNEEEEPTRRRHEHQGDEEVAGAKMSSSLGLRGWAGQKEDGKHPSPPKRAGALEANAEASRRNGGRRGEASNRREGGRCAGGSGTGAGVGAGVGEGGKGGLDPMLVKKEQGATFQSSLSSGLRPDSFDYLSAEDIRPSPNPSQELQRAVSSLPRADWPEIFHTLNSVRRLATHHARLLSSEPNLHALVRDVLSQAENLRSQVAKNSLLALADLWRGLGDALDPELPMVCPVLVKKMADKVEFLAEAARECVDGIVANASEARVLSAFLSCGNHRNPVVRAKSALAILLSVRRRYTDASTRGGGGSDGKGVGQGVMVPKELDRVLATLPRFLQDGHQETRIHARTLAGLLLETGEVDEARLRRELPPPTMKRLQRDLSNPSLPSGIPFAAPPSAPAPASTGRSNSTRRVEQGSTRYGYARSAGSVSSPSRFSLGSGGREDGGSCGERRFGGNLRDSAGERDPWLESKWQREERGTRSGGDTIEEKGLVSPTLAVTRRRSSRLRPDEKVGVSASCGGLGSRPSPLEGAARQSMRRSRVSNFKVAECLPEIHSRLDSGDWRERMNGLKKATALLEEHGEDINATGKNRLLDRMAELLSDGNLKVNILALESVARLASSSVTKLDTAVNTLAPAVCKNLASSNQQRVALAEQALDALCDAVDPCLLVQPVTSLAQYGNIRLKVPMLTLLRDLAPTVGDTKPILLKKHVRPAALSLVRENRSNIRDAALSLLRTVELALDPMYHPRGGAAAEAGAAAGAATTGGRVAAAAAAAAADEFTGHERRDSNDNNNAQPVVHRTFTTRSSGGKYSCYGGAANHHGR